MNATVQQVFIGMEKFVLVVLEEKYLMLIKISVNVLTIPGGMAMAAQRLKFVRMERHIMFLNLCANAL